MSGQERARAFNAVTRALPRDRFVSLSERQAVADAVLAELGYGTHRCVRCGQPQAQEDDTCPPCDGEIYREEILELRDEIKRLTEGINASDKRIIEQAAENQRLRAELDVKDAQIERLKGEVALRAGSSQTEQMRADLLQAERDRLRASVQRVRRLIDKGPSRQCGGQRYILANLISAALDQSDTSTPQQAADDTHAAGTGRNQTP